MSRFKNRKFDVICDSNGTNCWVPVEQTKQLLCDAMALEAENERLKSELDFYKQATRFETWDGQSWTAHYQIVNNGKPQGTK